MAKLLLLHLFVVAFASPVLGMIAYVLVEPPTDARGLTAVLAALVAGPLLLAFVWPITLAMGLVSFTGSWLAAEFGAAERPWAWTVIHLAYGCGCGMVFARGFTHDHHLYLSLLGALFGASGGWVLRRPWSTSPDLARNF